jgi:hypothetical protein
MALRRLTLKDLTIDDDDAFRGIGLYRDLADLLRASGYRFAVPGPGAPGAFWQRALFLNLTFWGGEADVLVDKRVPADVVAHVGWHHAARGWLQREGADVEGADAMFFGEAVASAFDLYLVGRLLETAPECGFMETQVPALTDAALDAGLSEEAVEAELRAVAAAPERAFEDLRALLFDASIELVGQLDLDAAAARLEALGARRFGAFLHHYELSNWILHARARAAGRLAPDPVVRRLDAELRAAGEGALELLERRCLPEV